ncbi:endo-beta-N-acetylglucosaminidase [Virgibacillus siamensis]|uniref:endo-beta-N-acetylglucosaminidase n=1 Tax=Virgibacillus siamensis TaxID=480071 RepID=UPI00098515C5|nr:discoidin domain-containing protein [Virgibacillus siamensis]
MKGRARSYFKFHVVFMSLIFGIAFLTLQGASAFAEEGENGVINEDYANKLSLKPVAPAFSVESLLNWSPEKDPDSLLNQASVPLDENRFKGHQINPLANPNAGITTASITTMNHDTDNSVGGDTFKMYAFDNWQLLDSFIYWTSSEEGIFALPSPDVVNAAHRNGVPVYATVGFPWGPGSPEMLAEMEAFTEKAADGTFPVADKMIEAAEYYGFDGYFINQEMSGVSEKTAKRMNEMMRYAKRKSDIRFSWYDAQANNGDIDYQNAVNEKNDMYVTPAEDGTYAVDEFFLNYNWGVDEINTTVATMRKHNRSPFDAYAGFEVQQNSFHTEINTNALLNKEKQPKVSIALYAPNSTMGLAKNPADFHKKETYFWTGPQGDPSKADDSSDWKGMARFVTDSSVIQDMPFTTNFNSGHGKKYNVNGKTASNEEWNNLSVQDIMPTWRWWIRGKGSDINVGYDFSKAYNGGNSLKFTGDLNPNSVNDVMLYSTKLDINDTTKIRVTYQNKPGAEVSLGVAFGKDYAENQMKYYPLPESQSGWKTTIINLGEDEGKTAYALSLRIQNSSELEDYQMNVGQISVYDTNAPLISEPANVKVEEKMLQTSYKAEARLSWKDEENALLYEVYQKNADGDKKLIGVTRNNHFYTSNITRTPENASADNKTQLLVVPVNKNYMRGEPAKVDFKWGVDTDATEVDDNPPSSNVALHANITDVSFENTAEPASSALDGSGTSKWAATNKDSGFMTIELDEPKTIRRWRVQHAESGGEAQNMNTIDFELLYKNEDGNWISAERITDNHKAVTDVVLDQPVKASEFKLKVHDSGSSPWVAIRIYEWQLFESDALPKTENIMMHFVTADNNKGANDHVMIENVRKGQVVRLYRSLDSNEVIAKKRAEKDGMISFKNLNFGYEAGRIYYTVQSPDLNESLKFSAGFLSEEPSIANLRKSVEFFEQRGEFSSEDAVATLKNHLKVLEHFEERGMTKQIIHHLHIFNRLLKNQEKNDQLSKEAYMELKADTDRLIEEYQ